MPKLLGLPQYTEEEELPASKWSAFILAEQFSQGRLVEKLVHTTKVGATIKKVNGYFQFYVYKQRMQPTVISGFFFEGGFALQNSCSHPHFVCPVGFVFASLE